MLLHSWWTFLVMVSTLGNIVVSGTNETAFPSRHYDRLFEGGSKITGSYVYYTTPSRVRCGAICINTAECWVYTYNRDTNQCGVLGVLTGAVTTEVAPSKLHTYYVSRVNGKRIERTTSIDDWSIVRNECQGMGGDLFVPDDTTHAIVLHYVLDTNDFWIGIERPSSGGNMYDSWIDINTGATPTTTLKWYSNSPNNAGGNQYYMALHTGFKNDLKNTNNYYGLCAI